MAAVTFARPALAEDEPTKVRLRGGIVGEAGAFVITGRDAATNAVGGLELHAGAQVGDVGIYAAPGVVVGGGGGFATVFSVALVTDLTLDDAFAIGLGPEAGVLIAVGTEDALFEPLYGGRVHAAFYPLPGDPDEPGRRTSLTVGIDLKFLFGSAGAALKQADRDQAIRGRDSVEAILFPCAFIGYEAY